MAVRTVGAAEAPGRRGVVSTFDEMRGLGTVTTSGGETLPFHCTEIADGSRVIAVGTPVRFRIAFRVLRIEAVDLAPSHD